jgi:hypothetical protein
LVEDPALNSGTARRCGPETISHWRQYIRAMERTNGQSYLSAIDLPVCERSKIFCELGYMGLTAGSLFPGLDGACEELRESNF